jgi:hypothetical protein
VKATTVKGLIIWIFGCGDTYRLGVFSVDQSLTGITAMNKACPSEDSSETSNF